MRSHGKGNSIIGCPTLLNQRFNRYIVIMQNFGHISQNARLVNNRQPDIKGRIRAIAILDFASIVERRNRATKRQTFLEHSFMLKSCGWGGWGGWGGWPM